MPTALVVIAHPDDESYPFAGTLSALAAAGWRCVVHCATSGEAGERQDEGGFGDLGAERRRELVRACEVLGAERPVFWGLRDGHLAGSRPRGEQVAAAISDAGADLVLSLGPDGAYGHPDHLALHRWVREGCERARAPLLEAAFPKGLFTPQYWKCRGAGTLGSLPPFGPDALGTDAPDIRLPLSHELRERKVAALAAHRSQLPGGDPLALFPPGIVDRLLVEEWFVVMREGPGVEAVRRLARSLGPCSAGP